jgi:hypothetical protein
MFGCSGLEVYCAVDFAVLGLAGLFFEFHHFLNYLPGDWVLLGGFFALA